jgi:transposase
MVSWRERLREKDKIIESQQKQIDELRFQLKEVKQFLQAFDNAHTPPSKKLKQNTKKEENEDKKKPRFPGKPKGGNGGGIKLPPPDDTIEHTLAVSPISGLPVGKPIGYRKKTIIDFPDKPIQVIEHRIMQYKDPLTGEIVEAQVDLPNTIYGPNIRSIVAMLKNLTNSHGKIADFLRELGAPSFSTERVQSISHEFTDLLEAKRDQLLQELRSSPYTHADETSMRKDGQKGYIWNVCTQKISLFFARMSRGRKEIKEILPNYNGVVVCDGYNAYDKFELRQRCWVHLIREVREGAQKCKEIEAPYKRLKLLYEQLKEMNTGPPNERAIDDVKWTLGDIATCLDAIKQGRKLAVLIRNGKDDWFTALYHEGVPLQNNHAERELRPLVLLRKTIGCYRNEKGQRWIDIVVSVLHTWKLQGINIFQQLRAVQMT